LNHLFCLLAILIWSSLEITGKLVGAGINPFALTAWRFVIGGLALMPFALRQAARKNHKLDKSSILRIASLGILNVCVSMLLLQLSIFYGKASLSAVIVSMNPLFVSVFALLLLKEKLDKAQLFSLLLGFGGLLVIVLGEGEIGSDNYRNLPLGIGFAVMASAIFGLYTVLTKSAVLRYGNLLTNSLSFISGGALLSIFSLAIDKELLFKPSLSNLGFMAYLGLIITGLAYLLYFEGMKRISAAKASGYFFLKPAVAVLLAFFILGETLTLLQLIGITLVIFSLNKSWLIALIYPSNPNKSGFSNQAI